jgi:hypothetical protein
MEEEDDEAAFRQDFRDPTSAFSDLLAAPTDPPAPMDAADDIEHGAAAGAGGAVGDSDAALDAAVHIRVAYACPASCLQ